MDRPPREYISQAEFARRIDVSPPYVNRLIREGRLSLKQGKKLLWPDDAEAYRATMMMGWDQVHAWNDKQKEARRNAEKKAA